MIYRFKFSQYNPLVNRNPGSSKIYINQQLIDKNIKRVIFRVIDRKL